jgi:hypothetical protein
MGRADFSYNNIAIAAMDTIDVLGCCNQNSHFNELDAGNDRAKATDAV